MSKTAYLHRFLRQPNVASSKYFRVGNRHDPFQNTLTVLKDPENKRRLFLIGTTNSSTLLANRTRELVSDVKPSSLIVQASENWWNKAKQIDVNTQAEWNLIGNKLSHEGYSRGNSPRTVWFKLKYSAWLTTLKWMCNFPIDFKFSIPGLQVKYAIEQAQKAGSNITFAGKEFDPETIEGLRQSSLLYFFMLPIRARRLCVGSTLKHQYDDLKRIMLVRGGEAFAESIDKYRANFLIHLLNRIAPEQKEVIIDLKDESLFYKIYQSPGDTIVAVVNQWHVTGIEERWRRATKTINAPPVESPVADMDIDQLQETYLINQFLRDRASKISHTEPATDRDYITQYTKENFEYERTRHTHHRSEADIPEPGEEHKKNGHH